MGAAQVVAPLPICAATVVSKGFSVTQFGSCHNQQLGHLAAHLQLSTQQILFIPGGLGEWLKR